MSFEVVPERRPPVVLIVVLVVLVFFVLLGVIGIWVIRHQSSTSSKVVGTACSGCSPCIREWHESYCSIYCTADKGCPSDYVCDPTRSGAHKACMKQGLETSPGVKRRTR